MWTGASHPGLSTPEPHTPPDSYPAFFTVFSGTSNVSASTMPVESVPTIQRSVKSVVFPVVMYRCESWTIKAPEYQY